MSRLRVTDASEQQGLESTQLVARSLEATWTLSHGGIDGGDVGTLTDFVDADHLGGEGPHGDDGAGSGDVRQRHCGKIKVCHLKKVVSAIRKRIGDESFFDGRMCCCKCLTGIEVPVLRGVSVQRGAQHLGGHGDHADSAVVQPQPPAEDGGHHEVAWWVERSCDTHIVRMDDDKTAEVNGFYS